MPRVGLPPYPERAKKLFQLTQTDVERAEKIRSFLQPINVLSEDDLTGDDRILGFRKEDLVKEWERGKHLVANRATAPVLEFSRAIAMGTINFDRNK